MFARNLIKRSLVAGLAIAAASLPAAAHARLIEDPPVAPSAPAAQLVNAPSPQQQLARLHANLEQRFAAEGGWPTATPVRANVTSHGDFQWGDAGIGAAGTVLLLGTSAVAASVMRRRRAHRPVTG
jgi:hypothetical protein